ncbi:DUF397 domain-containing protein [Streptomyces sp. NPDC087294]|uniref:DUF397 domain-containing protein n=1 Tax=Streptomyces sp. NPDC087294 TaxID=3365777 RepID=UPI00380C0E48
MTSASTSPVRWRKSSYSTNGGDCVEMGEGLSRTVPVRDSKDPHGPALMFRPSAWGSFVAAAQCGEFPSA